MATMLDLIKARQQSIFGETPEQLAARRQQEQQKTIMQQIQQAAPRSPTPAMTSLGIAIGSGLGQGLLSRFGGQDLEMQQAQQAQQGYNMLEEQVRLTEASDLASRARVAAFREKLNNATTEQEFNRLALIATSTPELVDMVTPILKISESMFPEQKGEDIEYERVGTINIGTPDNPILKQGVYSPQIGQQGYVENGKFVAVDDPTKFAQETGLDPSAITAAGEEYVLPNGDIVDTFFDETEGARFYLDRNNKITQIPIEGKKRVTGIESKKIPTRPQFTELRNKLGVEKSAIRRLKRYLDSREGAAQGLGFVADEFMGKFKTLINKGELTERQFNTLKAQGEFQSLIGQIRVETVGGGVMTEQDAIRVMQALGSFGALSNKKVVQAQIENILKSKVEKYLRLSEDYNSVVSMEGGYNTYKQEDTNKFQEDFVNPILADSTTQTEQKDWLSLGYVKMRNPNTGEERWVNQTTGDMQPVGGN